MTWQVFLTEEAEQRLLAIKDRRVRKLLSARAMKLQESPEQQGKPLIRDLAGYRSVRAVLANGTGSSMNLMMADKRSGW